jgi:hypothetical protein
MPNAKEKAFSLALLRKTSAAAAAEVFFADPKSKRS